MLEGVIEGGRRAADEYDRHQTAVPGRSGSGPVADTCPWDTERGVPPTGRALADPEPRDTSRQADAALAEVDTEWSDAY